MAVFTDELSPDLASEPEPSTPPELGISRGGFLDDFGTEDLKRGAEAAGYVPPDRTPHGVMGRIIDVVSRGQYASVAMIDSIFSEDGMAFGGALKLGMKEAIDPKLRMSFSDVIKKHAPNFAHENRKTTAVLGFIGDVALDPTTYLTLGASSAATKVGVRVGSKVGREAAEATGVRGIGRFLKRGVLRAEREGAEKINVKLNKKGSERLMQMQADFLKLENIGSMPKGEADDLLKRMSRLVREEGIGVLDEGLTAKGIKARNTYFKGLRDKGWAKEDAMIAANRHVRQMAHAGRVSGRGTAESFVESITPNIAGESAIQRMARIIESSVESAEKYVETGGVKFFGKTLLSGRGLKALNDYSGVTWMGEALRASDAGQWGIKFLSQDIPEEFSKIWKNLNSRNKAAERNIKAKAAQMFGKLSQDSRNKIGKLGIDIDDATTKARKTAQTTYENQQVTKTKYLNDLKAQGGGPPNKAFVDQLDTYPMVNDQAIQRQMVRDAKLTPEEHSAYVSMLSELQHFGKRELEEKLIDKLRLNYFPRQYDAIKDGFGLSAIRRKAQNMGTSRPFSPGEARKFETIAQAEKMGFTPIQDAGAIYTLRAMQHHTAINEKIFSFQAEKMFEGMTKAAGKLSPGDVRRWKLTDDANHLRQYIDYIGDGKYTNVTNKQARQALQMYDKGLQTFKTFATVARPAFGVRQLFSNHVQMFIGAGANGIKHLYDPRSAYDAALILRGKGTGQVRAGVELTGVFGEKMTGQQLLEESFEYDIVRNVSGVSGLADEPLNKRGSMRFMKQLDRQRKIKGATADSPAMQGLALGMEKAMRYTNAPAAIEDYSRMAMYVNMRRAGHAPGEAARLVDRALFDYQHALSIAEEKYIKRALPFYSFTRFAIPLMVEAAAKAPGRVANVGKAANTLMEVYGALHTNSKLTNEQREVLPGWLLEQPHAYVGVTEEMKARFNTFNNYSPLDVFGFVAEKPDGTLSVRETLQNAFLSQLTPLVKVPMELIIGKDFFTGHSITPESQRGFGDLNMNELAANLVGLVVGGSQAGKDIGTAAVGGGNALGELLGNLPQTVAEETLGRLLGMEEKIDPRTGKRTVYLNTYMVHMLTSMAPALTEAFKVSNEDADPLDKTKRFLFGIASPELDLQREKKKKIDQLKRERKSVQKAFAEDSINLSQVQYYKAKQELDAWMEDWVRERDILLGDVRFIDD